MIGYTIDYIIITHSGGVSLQQTKEERYTIIKCNFFCQNERFYLKETDCIRKNIDTFRLLANV